MATGLIIMSIAVSAGINFGAGGSGLLLLSYYAGVILGANLVGAGVRVADDPAPIVPVVFDGARALAAFLRRNLAAVGLVMASCAVTGVSGEPRPVLCFGMFTLLQLGLFLINIRVLGKH